MSTFVFRLKAPRPNFALDMSDEEREIMGRHAAYWQPLIDSGQMVVFGPVLDDTGSWGLGVVEAEDEGRTTRIRRGRSGSHHRNRRRRGRKDARRIRPSALTAIRP
jgi:YCII-related domain